MDKAETVIQKATRSVKWSILMSLANKSIPPLTYLVLASILTPEAFGVVATATIAINFAQIFSDFGLGKALVQTEEPVEEAANIVFWNSLILGLLIYGLLFLSSPYLASFFDSPPSMTVIRILGVQIIFYSLSTAQQGLLLRDLGFRKLFWFKLATVILPAFFSIPMALSGFGYWALVVGSLSGSILNTVLLWISSEWKPSLSIDRQIARKLLLFGLWTILEGTAMWFFGWGDNLFVGRMIGVEALGVYQVAWQIGTIAFGLLINSFSPILFPAFSRLQNDIPRLRETFRNTNKIVISLCLPAGVGFLLVGNLLQRTFLGPQWGNLGVILGIIGFMFGVNWLVGINPEVYRAIGRPDLNTKLMFIAILYYLPIYWIASNTNLIGFAIGRLVAASIAIPLHVFFAVRYFGLSPLYLWHQGKYIFAATLLMALAIVVFQNTFIPLVEIDFIALIFTILLGLSVYVTSLWILEKPFLFQARKLIKQVIG